MTPYRSPDSPPTPKGNAEMSFAFRDSLINAGGLLTLGAAVWWLVSGPFSFAGALFLGAMGLMALLTAFRHRP